MRHVKATLLLARCLLGCGTAVTLGERVDILDGPMPLDADECPRDTYIASQLIADSGYGVALAGYGGGPRVPVMWPPAFTGRRVRSEIAVVGPNGMVVAMTGQSYSIRGNRLYPDGSNDHASYRRGVVISPIGEFMLYACGDVRPAETGQPLHLF